jgi:hypothetical protein
MADRPDRILSHTGFRRLASRAKIRIAGLPPACDSRPCA